MIFNWWSFILNPVAIRTCPAQTAWWCFTASRRRRGGRCHGEAQRCAVADAVEKCGINPLWSHIYGKSWIYPAKQWIYMHIYIYTCGFVSFFWGLILIKPYKTISNPTFLILAPHFFHRRRPAPILTAPGRWGFWRRSRTTTAFASPWAGPSRAMRRGS